MNSLTVFCLQCFLVEPDPILQAFPCKFNKTSMMMKVISSIIRRFILDFLSITALRLLLITSVSAQHEFMSLFFFVQRYTTQESTRLESSSIQNPRCAKVQSHGNGLGTWNTRCCEVYECLYAVPFSGDTCQFRLPPSSQAWFHLPSFSSVGFI